MVTMLSVIWCSVLLGIDSFAVSLALGPLIGRRGRYTVAAAFGFCDGLAILISPLLRTSLAASVSSSADRVLPILLVAYAIYVLILARSAPELGGSSGGLFVFPIATSIDNLAVGAHLTSTLPIGVIAVIAAVTSATMSLAGLTSMRTILSWNKVLPMTIGGLNPRWVAAGTLLAAAAFFLR